jgi:alkanesulfonate monooxygenase SsuD/methylene tetrahydromethanopterin reductase-like flavin-dependent oxidoreductase (luciferase family)
VYTDPSRVRPINHSGTYYRVAGPHLSQPSPQRTPVIYQAGSSDAGRAFGGKHAEAVFIGGTTLESTRGYIEGYRAKAAEQGRDPSHIKFMAGAAVIVGRNDEQVARKVETFTKLRSIEGHLAHAGAGLDWTRYDPDTRVGDIIARKDPGYQRLIRMYAEDQTVGAILSRVGSFNRGPFFVAGTPKEVADAIEIWLDEGGIDGINLRQFLTPGTAEDFIELVVPELRRRGRYREGYEDGETLRERLFGRGHARLLPDHPGARYRDPAVLASLSGAPADEWSDGGSTAPAPTSLEPSAV